MTWVKEDHRRGMLKVVASLINCEWDNVVRRENARRVHVVAAAPLLRCNKHAVALTVEAREDHRFRHSEKAAARSVPPFASAHTDPRTVSALRPVRRWTG